MPVFPSSRFDKEAPAILALTKKSLQSGVVIAFSEVVLGGKGVYPAKAFAAGEVVFQAESLSGRWLPEDHDTAISADPRFCLEICLVQPFRRPQKMVCVGDPGRFPWANVNSSWGTGKKKQI